MHVDDFYIYFNFKIHLNEKYDIIKSLINFLFYIIFLISPRKNKNYKNSIDFFESKKNTIKKDEKKYKAKL